MYRQSIRFLYIYDGHDVHPNRNSASDFLSADIQRNGGRVAPNQTHNPTFIFFYFTSNSYIEYTFVAQLLMALKLALFRKYIGNTQKVSKCNAGEG